MILSHPLLRHTMLLGFIALITNLCLQAEDPLDVLTFGEKDSSKAHQLLAPQSELLLGGLAMQTLHLLPSVPVDWQGGSASFVLKVDPIKQTYFTIQLWGSDLNENRLILFCEGKQIGYRHLGDIDLLDIPNGSPAYAGRFYYTTSPLPPALTSGKTELHFEIRSSGQIWGYGGTWDKYQKPMTEPTRGIYRVFTHTHGCFVPAADDKQGDAPREIPVRQAPGAEVLDRLKARVSDTINKILAEKKPLDQMQMELIARAYRVKWTPAFQNPVAVQQVVKGADEYFREYRKDSTIAQADKLHPSVYNNEWLGLGPLGNAIRLLKTPLQSSLNETIQDGIGASVTRSQAWSEMLQASRDWHRHHRRQYTNQTMITDLYFYLDNLGIAAIDPVHALPEDQIRHYLYESVGLQPWLGSDTDQGPQKPLGDDYFQLTDKGLTKELGFVGYYGEVLDWATTLYLTTADPDKPGSGDEKIKAQLVKMAHARSYFRYPELDNDGNRAMRAETIVGWRDPDHYPGDILYGERPTWDASSLYMAAATLDPQSVGAVQQMFADNQFFHSLELQMKEMSLRATSGLLEVPDQYDLLKAQSSIGQVLPMTAGQPDFAWADEQDGVLALKHNGEILYASLYWRARNAINFLARVHYLNPRFDRIAVVHEETEFEPSGLQYTRPDWTNMGFGNGGIKYPGDLHSAEAGEVLAIAKIPENLQSLNDGVHWTPYLPGQESPFAGRGSFYRLEYGNYLIGMNTTKDKTYSLPVPAGFTEAPDLISKKVLPLKDAVSIGPESTVILYLKK